MKRHRKFLFLIYILILFCCIIPGQGNAQAPPTDPGCDPLDPACPIDGGITVLIIAAVVIAAINANKMEKQCKKYSNFS